MRLSTAVVFAFVSSLTAPTTASWIAGKKVVESIAGADDLPINFATIPVAVHSSPRGSFTTNVHTHTETPLLFEEVQSGLVQSGVRESEAKYIAEWASGAAASAFRSFDFKYVNDIGSLVVKQITCSRKPTQELPPDTASDAPHRRCKRKGPVGELKSVVRPILRTIFNACCWMTNQYRTIVGEELDFFHAQSEIDITPLFPAMRQMMRLSVDTTKITLPAQRWIPPAFHPSINLQQPTGEWVLIDLTTLPLFQGTRPFPLFYYDEDCVEWADVEEDAGKELIAVSCDIASAFASCTVPALKNVHHEKTVTRRVVGVRVKRWTERWTTQERRGLTRAELDQLVELMSGKVYEAMAAPPKLESEVPHCFVPEPSESQSL